MTTPWTSFDTTKPTDNRRWDKADDDIRTNWLAIDARIGSNAQFYNTEYADLDAATDEHFTLADHADFDADGSDYSFAFYLNSAVADPDIATKGGVFANDSWSIVSEYVSGSRFDIALKHRTGAINHFCLSGFDINANKNAWFHIIGAYDQTAGNVTWWISSVGGTFGDQINGSAVSMGGAAAANTGALFLGGVSATATLDGAIDEFAWFKGHVLTAAEAEEIYKGVGSGGWREAAPPSGWDLKGGLAMMGVGL